MPGMESNGLFSMRGTGRSILLRPGRRSTGRPRTTRRRRSIAMNQPNGDPGREPAARHSTARERELEVELARVSAQLEAMQGGDLMQTTSRFLEMAANTVDLAMADARREADELAARSVPMPSAGVTTRCGSRRSRDHGCPSPVGGDRRRGDSRCRPRRRPAGDPRREAGAGSGPQRGEGDHRRGLCRGRQARVRCCRDCGRDPRAGPGSGARGARGADRRPRRARTRTRRHA